MNSKKSTLRGIIESVENGIIKSKKEDILKYKEQIKKYYGDTITEVSVSDNAWGSYYYIIGSIHDLSDQTQLYRDFYIEDSEGYTIFDTCQVNICEV